MITSRQIRKLVDEHVKDREGLFEIDKMAARVNFLAGVIAVLKLQNRNDIRFMNIVKSEEWEIK